MEAMIESLDKRPEHYTELDDGVMSNFDHEIDEAIAEKLRSGPAWAPYSAYNFNGQVWYCQETQQFRCEIWRYHEHVETLCGTLEEIMSEACEQWGSE